MFCNMTFSWIYGSTRERKREGERVREEERERERERERNWEFWDDLEMMGFEENGPFMSSLQYHKGPQEMSIREHRDREVNSPR